MTAKSLLWGALSVLGAVLICYLALILRAIWLSRGKGLAGVDLISFTRTRLFTPLGVIIAAAIFTATVILVSHHARSAK